MEYDKYLNIITYVVLVHAGGSPDIELLSGGSYTSGHTGCLGDVTVGTNSTSATFIPLVPVFGVEVTRCTS